MTTRMDDGRRRRGWTMDTDDGRRRWTTTMDADEDGRCRRRTDAGVGGGELTTAAPDVPDGEDDGATDGRDGVARNEGNSCSDGVF
ncbi:Os11g0119533 [Oryza sativa Japonica Group]|uniref:Os11g0119533 protein n=1 Tax=Oryza sativa subsp. japonica TaxID=39947 RepID=A0A0N7KSC6_ORYSJ|nr:Os11g0119533 [Oryza sativa Japonica Group]